MRLKNLPDDAKVYDVFSRRPATFEPFTQTCEQIMRGPSALSPVERELIGNVIQVGFVLVLLLGQIRSLAELAVLGLFERVGMVGFELCLDCFGRERGDSFAASELRLLGL